LGKGDDAEGGLLDFEVLLLLDDIGALEGTGSGVYCSRRSSDFQVIAAQVPSVQVTDLSLFFDCSGYSNSENNMCAEDQ
jgi:hypothetical protein